MEKGFEIINVDRARLLIEKKNGLLNEQLSILPAVEVYELNDNTLISIKIFLKKATYYFNRDEAIIELRKTRPKGFFENYQKELHNFPQNKELLLGKLTQELGIKIDPANFEIEYLENITAKIKEYTISRARDSLLLELVVFMGEEIIHEKGGHWEIEQVKFPHPQLQPYIINNAGKKELFFIKIIIDGLIGKKEFDWATWVLFITNPPPLIYEF